MSPEKGTMMPSGGDDPDGSDKRIFSVQVHGATAVGGKKPQDRGQSDSSAGKQ